MNYSGTKLPERGRLSLRRFAAKDAGDMYRSRASNLAVTGFLTWSCHAPPQAPARRQGFAGEAPRRVIDGMAGAAGANRVESRRSPNGAAARQYGMTRGGAPRRADRNNQGVCVYAIPAEERRAKNGGSSSGRNPPERRDCRRDRHD